MKKELIADKGADTFEIGRSEKEALRMGDRNDRFRHANERL